jgi:hypothetical protein
MAELPYPNRASRATCGVKRITDNAALSKVGAL